MTAKTHTINVRGQVVRTRTPRRFIVIVVRPEPVTDDEGRTYVAFAEVQKRTDNGHTAATMARRYNQGWSRGRGCFAVVYDTATGTEQV